MRKFVVFVLVLICIFGLLGCSKEETLIFSHAVVCPDCGGYRNEDAETCTSCARNEKIKEWFESEQNDENTVIQIDN